MKVILTLFLSAGYLGTLCFANPTEEAGELGTEISSPKSTENENPSNISLSDLKIGRELIKPSCKPITFLKEQYQRTEDGIFIPAINESFQSFIPLDDKSVKICYPFSLNFEICKKWGLYQEEYTVLPNYKLHVPVYENAEYDIGDYNLSDNKIAYVCIPDWYSGEEGEGGFADFYVRNVYPALWIISCIFLVLTGIIIYFSKLKLGISNVVQLCHIISITTAYVFLITRRFATENTLSESWFCIFQAVNIQWWFLTAFTWLNILAFHIWLNMVDRNAGPTNRLRSLRFVLYSFYALLTPTLIAGTSLILDLYYTERESALKPRFDTACWFNNTNSLVAFFYGPMALFVLINIIFFILIVCLVQKKAQESLTLNGKKQLKLILVYVRLLVIMGVWWILEVVSWAMSDYKTLTCILDTITGLQGFFIFFAYQAHQILWYFFWNRSCNRPASDDDVLSQNSVLPVEHYKTNIQDNFDRHDVKEKVDV